MTKQIWLRTPIYFVAVAFLAIFFLSCTKKPSTQVTAAAPPQTMRTPSAVSHGMITTQHGYKVQLEPVQFGSAPAGKDAAKQ